MFPSTVRLCSAGGRPWTCRQRLEITQPHQQTCESNQLLVYRIMWLISCLLHQCKSDAIIWHRYTTNKLFQTNNRDVITQTFEPLFSQQVNSDEVDRNVCFSVIYWVYKCPFCFIMPLALNCCKTQTHQMLMLDICAKARKQEIYSPWILLLDCPAGYDIIFLHQQQKFNSTKWLKNTYYISLQCRFCLFLPFIMTLRIL